VSLIRTVYRIHSNVESRKKLTMLMQRKRPVPPGAPAPAPARAQLAGRSLRVVFAVLVCLGAILVLSGIALAAPRSPSTSHSVLSPHQYAETTWFSTQASGNSTRLDPRGGMSCSGCQGFIDNEMWWFDDASSACTNTGYGACWVEVGVSTYRASAATNCHAGVASVCLFWADNRSLGGGYHEHPMWDFGGDGVDLTPYYIDLTIFNHFSHTNGGVTWDVHTNIIRAIDGVSVGRPGGQSTNNNMAVTGMTIGSELSDTAGRAAVFGYIDNKWQGSTGGWHYHAVAGSDTSSPSPPPYGAWTINPTGAASNTGGRYETHY
jgi:hypothetical protein